jgi:hypothetical protein
VAVSVACQTDDGSVSAEDVGSAVCGDEHPPQRAVSAQGGSDNNTIRFIDREGEPPPIPALDALERGLFDDIERLDELRGFLRSSDASTSSRATTAPSLSVPTVLHAAMPDDDLRGDGRVSTSKATVVDPAPQTKRWVSTASTARAPLRCFRQASDVVGYRQLHAKSRQESSPGHRRGSSASRAATPRTPPQPSRHDSQADGGVNQTRVEVEADVPQVQTQASLQMAPLSSSAPTTASSTRCRRSTARLHGATRHRAPSCPARQCGTTLWLSAAWTPSRTACRLSAARCSGRITRAS